MKFTKSRLQKIIQEELMNMLDKKIGLGPASRYTGGTPTASDLLHTDLPDMPDHLLNFPDVEPKLEPEPDIMILRPEDPPPEPPGVGEPGGEILILREDELEKETPTLRQELELTNRDIQAMTSPSQSSLEHHFTHGYNRGTKMAPIVDGSPMGGPEATRKFKEAHGRDPREGDTVYYLGQNKRGDWEYSTFTFGKMHVPDTPAQRRAKLKETIQEEYDKLLGEVQDEENSVITDFSTNEIGRTPPPGVSADEWSGVGTSIVVTDI